MFNFAQEAEAAWFNDNWAYRKAIPVTSTNGSDQTNVFVSFTLDTATLITNSQLQSSCQDIRITDVSGDIIPYHVGRTNACNLSNTTIDFLPNTLVDKTSTFYVYYGNPAAGSRDVGAFSVSQASNYTVGTLGSAENAPQPRGYWKMDEGYGGIIQDSTTNNLDAVSNYAGDGADGAVTFSSAFNLNTTAARSCSDDSTTYGASLGWAPIYISTASTVAASTTLALTTNPVSTCLTTGDEVLIINLMGTSSDNSNVGKYETKTISSISTNTLTFSTGLSNTYDGTTQKIMVMRIPNFTTVAVNNTVTLTGLDFDGTAGGIIFFRATGAVTLNSTGIISANGLGYLLGAGGITGQTGTGGQSYDGNGTTTSATNGNGKNGVSGGAAGTGSAGTRGGGGGGGKASSTANTSGAGGAGGGYGGGGGGAGGGISSGSGGTGGTGGDTLVAAGGGGSGGGSAGGNAGSAGSGSVGGAVGSGATTGEGGGVTGDSGGGGGGGGLYGSSSLASQIFLGSGGGGGGCGTGATNCSATPGEPGGDGGGVVMISASSFTSFGSGITANGNAGTATSTRKGGGGGGSGGSVLINANSGTALGTNLITATGGAGGTPTSAGGGGGSGGVGRINVGNPSSGTTNPTYGSPSSRWQTEDDCVSGKCLYFNGENDTVVTPDTPALDFAAADNFSVSSWVKRNGASSAINYILSKADTTTGGYKLWMDADGDFCFGIDDDSSWGPDVSACSTNANFDDDKWHFVTGVRSVTDDKVYVYVDGIQKDSQTDPTTGTLANTNAFYIGVDRDGTSNLWLGFVDDVKVYPTAHSATQVAADFASRGGSKGSAEVLGANTQNNPNALSNGLVGYWTMQETATPSLDSSGNSNSGTWNGDTSALAGKFGNSARFDGINDYIEVTDSNSLDVTNITISAWMNAAADSGMIVSKATGAAGTDGYLVDRSGLKIRFCATGGCASSTTSLTTNIWQHIVITFDGTTTRFYLNGVPDGTATTATSVATNAVNLRMGVDSNSTSDYFGQIDDVRIYNRALSSADVYALYNWAPTPVGYWNLDEKSGTTANDISGNGNSGLITAGTGGYQAGKYGSAYNFDLASTVIDAGSGTTLDNLPAGGMSLSAWIYPKSAGENSLGFIMAKNVGTSPSAGWVFRLNSTTSLTFSVDGSTDLVRTTNTSVVTQNAWNHVEVTWDGVITTASSVKIYVNGSEVTYATTTNGASRVDDGTSTFFIGNDSTSARTFDGKIDEARVYNYARTPGQVIEDMNGDHPAPGSPVGSPTALFKFDEGYGYVASDQSTNHLAGYINELGSGSDGAVTFSSNFNINTSAARSCTDDATTYGASLGWAPIYVSTLSTNSGSTSVTLTTSPASTCLTAGDEILIINLMGTTTDNANVGKYETRYLSGVSGAVLSLQAPLTNGYDGTTQKIMVMRVPNFTTVAVNNTITLTGLDFDGTAGGIIFFRATGAVTLNSTGIISANGLGYLLGAGGVTGFTGTGGQSYDGNADAQATGSSGTNGFGKTAGDGTSAGTAGTRGGGGGGGKASATANTSGAGGAGGGYGGGGGGAGGGITSGTGGAGGTGGDTDVNAGGGGASGGAGGNAGSAGETVGGNEGGAAGSGATTGQGGGAGTSNGSGGGGGGLYGSSSLTSKIFLGSGGGGGGCGTGATNCSATPGEPGGDGGGVVMISASSFTSFGSGITANGNAGTATSTRKGGGGGGSGGSILLRATTSPALTSGITATGGAGGAPSSAGGGGGSGGVGRINASASSLTSSNPDGILASNAAGTPTWTNSGKYQKALNFDGSDDGVTVPNSDPIDFDTNLANFTFSTWINADTAGESNVGQIFNKGTNTYLRVDTPSGSNLDVEANLDLATTDANVNISAPITTGSWHYLAITWDGTTLKVYINGLLRGSGTGSGTISADTNDLLIGGPSTANFDGTIDDFKVYNSALTSTQVALDANQGKAVSEGALSDNSSYQKWGANQEYCVPGDITSCASPVGEWHLNEKAGILAFDTSGNGNDLTLTNTPTFTTGRYGAAINLAGSNQHLIRADDADFDFAGAASFVLTAWIKHTASPGTQEEIISKFATQGYKLLMETDGDITCTITDDAAQTDSATSTAATYDDNKWHHVACVKNASTSLTLYIDGAQVAQDTSIGATSTLANTDPIYIGIDEDATSEDWVGQIDEVKIFNYARTGAQVAWDYNRGGPVGWWKMDDCQGTTAYDASVTNANNGTWSGAGGGNTSAGDCTTVDTATAWYNGRTGKFNNSLDFDGTDDVVTVTNATSIDLNDNLAATHTFSAWIYANNAGEGSGGQVYWKGATTFLRVDSLSGGRLDVEAQLDLATDATVNISSAIAVNTWNHIVVVYTDDADDEIDVYINGILKGSSTDGSGAPAAESNNLLIGGTTTDNFDGQIDDTRIYNYALTATQVKTLMNQNSALRYGPVTGSP